MTADENADPPVSHFFERVDDPSSLTPDDFLDRFERFGFLWFKGSAEKTTSIPTKGNEILDFIGKHSSACEPSWTFENDGTLAKSDADANKSGKGSSLERVTPKELRGFTGTAESFYVSTIVHRKSTREEPSADRDDSSEAAHNSLMKLLPRFDNVFEDIYDIGDPSGTWLFLGHHGVISSADADDRAIAADATAAAADAAAATITKKRKRPTSTTTPVPVTTNTLAGRAEHVDDVTHSGTYHVQIAGTKTWKIRPHPDSFVAEELLLDESESENENENESNPKKNSWKLKIRVEEGDVFVLNTKAWFHCTELNYDPKYPLSSSEWSISAAHDFYLPVPCPRDVAKGDVVYGCNPVGREKENTDDESAGSEADQEIPDELPRSDNPNCALVEIDENEDEDNDHANASANANGGDSDDETSAASTIKIALVALRDIPEGESLTIAFDDAQDQLGNANEQVDPRLIAGQHWKQHDIVLRGEDRIPPDIPRSYEPNCELLETNDDLTLRALVDIPVGGVFCILPDKHEEYEEVEVDLGTGELVQ